MLFFDRGVDSQRIGELLEERLLLRSVGLLGLLEHVFDFVVLFFEQLNGVHRRCLRKGLP